MSQSIKAVLWDVGGVIFSSPFEAFARYEREHGLPADFIRGLNAANPDLNAWAQLEQSAVSIEEFYDLFEAEARAAGGELKAIDVLGCLSGDVRPEMIEAIQRIRAHGLKTAMLTNNFVGEAERAPASRTRMGLGGAAPGDREHDGSTAFSQLFELFDVIVESSKVGVRKPDPRFYEMALKELEIAPTEAVFLDDLGVNLKPARAMGMTTVKVVTPEQALADLETVVGFPLR